MSSPSDVPGKAARADGWAVDGPGGGCYGQPPDNSVGVLSLQPSAEVRWFFSGPCPGRVVRWFASLPGPMVEEPERIDSYLVTESATTGIKIRDRTRDGRLMELKVKQRDVGPVAFGAATGRFEYWVKWSFDVAANDAPATSLALPPGWWLDVRKTRRIRVYGPVDGALSPSTKQPEEGCNSELVHLRVRGADWWGLGYESFPSDETLVRLSSPGGDERALDLRAIQARLDRYARSTAQQELAAKRLPRGFGVEDSRSYPAWLRSLLRAQGGRSRDAAARRG